MLATFASVWCLLAAGFLFGWTTRARLAPAAPHPATPRRAALIVPGGLILTHAQPHGDSGRLLVPEGAAVLAREHESP